VRPEKLELKPIQILELHQYLKKKRPTILKEITAPRAAKNPVKSIKPK